jgi:hypothetical protein
MADTDDIATTLIGLIADEAGLIKNDDDLSHEAEYAVFTEGSFFYWTFNGDKYKVMVTEA